MPGSTLYAAAESAGGCQLAEGQMRNFSKGDLAIYANGHHNSVNTITAGVNSDTLVFTHWLTGCGVVCDQVSVRIRGAGGVGSTARIGFYEFDPTRPDQPGNLIIDFGSASTAAVGLIQFTTGFTFPRGHVFACITSSNAAGTLYAGNVGQWGTSHSFRGVNSLAAFTTYSFRETVIGGSPPAAALPATAPPILYIGGNVPGAVTFACRVA